ncbi:MAG TPA: ATP-binding protein [Streptosporangiaceae bacterium]|nr:ATP-binding protein [Streptosporangiaceae bacterium]
MIIRAVQPENGRAGSVPGFVQAHDHHNDDPERSSGTGPATNWLAAHLVTYLELAPLPPAVGCARGHAKAVLWEWGLSPLAETVTLLVSELVTNAIAATALEGLSGHWFEGKHCPGQPPVRLWLRSDGECVVIECWDGSESEPTLQEPDADVDSGRGLMLVAALAAYWGVDKLAQASGKVTWAIVTGSS